METSTSLSSSQADVVALRRKAVLHEFLELLALRQRAVAVGVGGVVFLGLLLTIVVPGLVPSTPLVGVVVGLLALAAGVALAFVAHRQDPVLRAPGQARWDGLKVMSWVPSLEPSSLSAVVGVVEDRIKSGGRHRLLVLDGGAGSRDAAAAVGGAAADVGARTLVVDLTDMASQPGMAAVGDGSMTLGAAATVDRDRNHATIGAGPRIAEAVDATRALLARPKRDLDLIVVVAPDDDESRRALLPVVDRAVLVVAAGTRQRVDVNDQLTQFESAVPLEVLLVGGQVTDSVPGSGRWRRRPTVVEELPPGAPDDEPPSVVVLSSGHSEATPPSTPPSTPPDDLDDLDDLDLDLEHDDDETTPPGPSTSGPPSQDRPEPSATTGATDHHDPGPHGGGVGTATAIAVAPSATDVMVDERPPSPSPSASVSQGARSRLFRRFRVGDADPGRPVDEDLDRPWAWDTTIDLTLGGDEVAEESGDEVAGDGAVSVVDESGDEVAGDGAVGVAGDGAVSVAGDGAVNVAGDGAVDVAEDGAVDRLEGDGDQADDAATLLLADSQDPDATAEAPVNGSSPAVEEDVTAAGSGDLRPAGDHDEDDPPVLPSESPATPGLEATDDLVTTATLEFLATGEPDERR